MIQLNQKPFYLEKDALEWVETTIGDMDVRQKAGQLFCLLGDLYDPQQLEKYVSDYHVGGLLLRPDTTKKVLERYSSLDRLTDIPLLKAANLEEGGCGAITQGTRFATQMQVSATGNSVWAERLGLVSAAEAKVAGINWTFSPVVDIDLNHCNPITNTRTYGSNPETVAEMAKQYMLAVQENGIAACVKHFPGDGVDFRDHHLHPTVNSLGVQEWYDSYGIVYRTMIDSGVISVMAGHITQPAVSREINTSLQYEDVLPGSLSRELLTGVLREKFGFNGLIVTDATIMGGYTQAMERSKAIPATIAAGCDMILFNTSFEQDYQYLLDGIAYGIVSPQRLDEAVSRVLAMKAYLGLHKPRHISDPRFPIVEWAKECADESVTLVKKTDGVLPLSVNKNQFISIISLGNDCCPAGSISEITKTLLELEGFSVRLLNPLEENMRGPNEKQCSDTTIYLANYETRSDQTTVRIDWSTKLALDLPRFTNEEQAIFVSFANPYHLQDVPRIKTFINAYTATLATITALVRRLIGEELFRGISPIDAFCGLKDTHL